MIITELKEISDLEVVTFQNLISQLTPNYPPITKEVLKKLIHSNSTTLFIAKNKEGEIVGTLSMVRYKILTGLKFWMEDVVVDKNYRGQGIGEKLIEEAIKLATENGGKTIDLTSNMQRISAHRLYNKMGFDQRQTGVFRYTIPQTNNKEF